MCSPNQGWKNGKHWLDAERAELAEQILKLLKAQPGQVFNSESADYIYALSTDWRDTLALEVEKKPKQEERKPWPEGPRFYVNPLVGLSKQAKFIYWLEPHQAEEEQSRRWELRRGHEVVVVEEFFTHLQQILTALKAAA